MLDNIKVHISIACRSQVKIFPLWFWAITYQFEAFEPNFTVVLFVYNTRWKTWRGFDITISEGVQFDVLTLSKGLYQLINEPTHRLPSSWYCIDLTIANEPNLVISFEATLSLYATVIIKSVVFKQNVKIKYPPPFQHLVWSFKRTDITFIRTVWFIGNTCSVIKVSMNKFLFSTTY